MKSPHVAAHLRKRIEDLSILAGNAIPDDIYHMLHHSFVDIVRMRRSIEAANIRLEASTKAVEESREILARLRRQRL
jgi:hypothetical protein